MAVEFKNCRCARETRAAILVSGVEDEDIWIPKSQVDDDSEVYRSGTDGTLVISDFIAEKKNLV